MKEYIFACDIGGTSVKCGLATMQGELTHFFNFPIERGAAVLTSMKQNLLAKLKELQISYDEIQLIGIATKGAFDDKTGVVINAKGIGWVNYPLVKEAKSVFKRPIAINNDCRSATIGEWKYGAARSHENFICIALGRGVGSGIVLNNQLLTGSFNGAGEIGHGGFAQRLHKCDCGLQYCCEAISSSTGMEWYINRFANDYPDTSIGILRRELGRPLVFPDVDPLFAAKDHTIQKVVKEALQPLASRISQIIFLLDIEAVFFGGKISEVLGDNLINPIKEQVHETVWPAIRERVIFRTFELGNQAALYGIVAWTLEKNRKNDLY